MGHRTTAGRPMVELGRQRRALKWRQPDGPLKRAKPEQQSNSRVLARFEPHADGTSLYYLGKVVKERTVPLAARCARHRRWCPRCCQHSHWSHARVGRMGRPPLRTAAKSSPGTDILDGRASPQGWTARKIMAQLSMVPAAARFAAARSSGLSVLC